MTIEEAADKAVDLGVQVFEAKPVIAASIALYVVSFAVVLFIIIYSNKRADKKQENLDKQRDIFISQLQNSLSESRNSYNELQKRYDEQLKRYDEQQKSHSESLNKATPKDEGRKKLL